MKFIVGSRNPVKINAVREVIDKFSQVYDYHSIEPVEVDSGVSKQPLSLEETTLGAKNRAYNSFEENSYSIGIEFGLMKMSLTRTGYVNITVCAIYDGKEFFIGLGNGFEMPEDLTNLVIEKGLDVDEATFKIGLTTNERCGYSEGLLGIISDGKLNRKDNHAKPAVEMAFVSLYHKLPNHSF